MVRFSADVDSPPMKPVIPKIKQEKGLKWGSPKITDNAGEINLKSPRRRRRSWFKKTSSPPGPEMASTGTDGIRKLKVERIPSQSSSRGNKKKTLTRCSIEVSILIAIALTLGYFGVKDMSFTSKQCDTRLPETFQKQLVLELQQKIFRQDIAIQNLTALLKSHSGVTTMSFVGGCGTGKSYTAKLMAEYYSKGNYNSYAWTGEEKHLHHVAALQELILSLPTCRPELLIVDNLSWEQKPYVEDMFRWLKSSSRMREKNLIVLFAFNFDRYGEEGKEKWEANLIGELEKTNVVHYKSFQDADAKDYLVQFREDQNEGAIELNSEKLELIVENANVKQYGLKRLANKFQRLG